MIALLACQLAEDMAVVFHHRTTPRDVHDHRIQLFVLKGPDVLLHELQRWLRGPTVIMDGTATPLAAWDHNIAPIFLQDTSRCPVHVPKHGVGHATDKQSHTSPPDTFRWQKFRKLRKCCLELRQLSLHPP